MSEVIQHLLAHWDDMLTGATGFAILAHAVNTFPVPQSRFGSWALGVIQFAVGQRDRARANATDRLQKADLAALIAQYEKDKDK